MDQEQVRANQVHSFNHPRASRTAPRMRTIRRDPKTKGIPDQQTSKGGPVTHPLGPYGVGGGEQRATRSDDDTTTKVSNKIPAIARVSPTI